MPDTTPTTAESVLGPITPIRCTEPGCHWSVHGVPDKYTESRARILADHKADEHATTADKAAALGKTPTAYRQYRHDAAVEQIREAVGGLLAETGQRVMDALEGRTDQQPETAPTCPQCGDTGACNGGPCPLTQTAPADRRARYAAAIREADGWVLDDGQHMLDAVMAVADTEQAELRAEVKNNSRYIKRLDTEYDSLRAELEAHRLALSDALGLGTGAPWDAIRDRAAELHRLADEAQQPDTEAHPAEHTWAAELHDPLADEWVPGTRYLVRERAVNHLEHSRQIAPTWKDGTPTQRRLVRATTTYTVVADEQPETEAAKCTYCGGSGIDPDDEGDYVEFVHMHDPGSRGPCPKCNGTGRPTP